MTPTIAALAVALLAIAAAPGAPPSPVPRPPLAEGAAPRDVAATQHPYVAPILVGARFNPVLRLRVDVPDDADPIAVTEVALDLDGTTDLRDLALVEVFATGATAALDHHDSRTLFDPDAALGDGGAPAERVVLDGRLALEPGANHLWVSVTPAADADLDHRADVRCLSIRLDDGRALTPEVDGARPRRRFGVALRTAGDDGVAAYRIPGLATTNRGTLVAVYDARRAGFGDLPGDIDVAMSRSTDGGRTFEPMRVILDLGDDPAMRHDGVGDPAVLVDRETGTIWVAALWSHGDRGWHGSGPGLAPEETGQLVLTRSDDDGRTWSAARVLTPEVKDPRWRLLLQGPGKGITLRDGTLAFAAQFRDADGTPHATVLTSRDHGETWSVGTGAKPDTTEAQVVELDDGVLMLNMRDDRGGARSVAITRDLGRTWEEHPTTRRALVEPVCMASLVRLDDLPGAARSDVLLFSNPAVARPPRRDLTVKTSLDLGASWSAGRLVDEGRSAGYSCLSRIDAATVGLLFEGSTAHLAFVRLPVAELLTDPTAAPNRDR